MILKLKGSGTSPPRVVFVFLFAGVILRTPGVQVMAKALCQLLYPMQYRLCCSILSLCLRKCFPDKFANLSLTNGRFSCPCRLDLTLQQELPITRFQPFLPDLLLRSLGASHLPRFRRIRPSCSKTEAWGGSGTAASSSPIQICIF